jgi:putative oxidoreductase
MKAASQHISTCFLLLLYAYTGLHKLFEQSLFQRTLSKVLSGYNGAATLAWLIPSLELVVVLLLFFEQTRKSGLYASLLLLVLFTSYLVYMVLFVADLPCSCGGVLNKMSWKQHIFFNLFFIAINLFAIGRFRFSTLFNFLRRQGMPKT